MYANKIINSIILISLTGVGILGFTGCAEKQIEVVSKPEERIKLNLSEPNQLKLKPVNFYVITDKNKEAVFKQLEIEQKDKVLIGMSDDDYIKMSENLILIQNYIVQQRFIIKSYKDYYESNESSDSNIPLQNKKD